MVSLQPSQVARRNVRAFSVFRMCFTARFYYPVYALLFLDYGLTLQQFGILNGIWAATIVLLEVPSGALADVVGRRPLLIVAGVCMVLEMAVLLAAPIGGGTLLFSLFVLNRILSGVAEAAASGADEALTYDSLQAAGEQGRWGHVLEAVQRNTSLAFLFAMTTGAAVYDAALVNALLSYCGFALVLQPQHLVKLPIALSLLSALMVLAMAVRMHEAPLGRHASLRATLTHAWHNSLATGRWIWMTALPFAILLAAMVLDSVVRQFLTLASQYWQLIEWPIASFGLIGSGMALMGVFVPRAARLLAERTSARNNLLWLCAAVLLGLLGLAQAVPYWGILPAVLLYAAIQFTGFFVSRYLNEVAPSEQRATVLSFRGLATNFTYGVVSLLYAGLVLLIRDGQAAAEGATAAGAQLAVFAESLGWLPCYFLFTLAAALGLHRWRFAPSR